MTSLFVLFGFFRTFFYEFEVCNLFDVRGGRFDWLSTLVNSGSKFQFDFNAFVFSQKTTQLKNRIVSPAVISNLNVWDFCLSNFLHVLNFY